MPRDRGGHSFERILAATRAENPGEGQRREAADGLNRAAASGIDHPVAHGCIDSELREPAAAPDPMREEGIRPSSQKRRGSTGGRQSPAVQARAHRNQGSQSHTEDLQACGERNRGAIEFNPAKKK